jgi:site-specific recombinase XerC
VLLGCGLRRAELATVSVQDLQKREEHWVFADLIGKGGHVRTVPIPDWVGNAVNSGYQTLRSPLDRSFEPSIRPVVFL